MSAVEINGFPSKVLDPVGKEELISVEANGLPASRKRPSAVSDANSAREWLTKRNFYCVIYTICFIGCVWQLFHVFTLYLSYETVTNLSIERPKTMIPPSMSICFPYVSLINFTLLFEKQPIFRPIAERIASTLNQTIDFDKHRMKNFKTVEGEFDYEFSRFILKEMTIKEILQVTIPLEALFEECMAKSPDTYAAEKMSSLTGCQSIWDTDYYVKGELKCFVFHYKNTANKDYTYNIEKLSSTFSFRTLLHYIRLDPEVLTKSVEKAYLIFHPRKRLPRGETDVPFIFKKPARNVSFLSTYKRTQSTLLPRPYESECVDYPSLSKESREHCIETCAAYESLNIYGRAPYTIVFGKNADVKIIGYREVEKNATLAQRLYDIFESCRLNCQSPACTHEVYSVVHLNEEETTNLKFGVEIPSEMDIITKLSPKLSFTEYIIYNTSVMSFWFGLCILRIAEWFLDWKKKRKYAKKLMKAKEIKLAKFNFKK